MKSNLISGKERRELKKNLHELKRFVKNFHFYNDINSVYGGGLSKIDSREIIDNTMSQISRIENMLKL